jgi:GNAT superfamily N-acetyltransferase
MPLVRLINTDTAYGLLADRLIEMNGQSYECIAAYNNNKILGYLGLWCQTRRYSSRCAEPSHMVLAPKHSPQEIGEKMLSFVLTYAKNKGCEVAQLNYYFKNITAQNLRKKTSHKKLGYHCLIKLNLPHK